MGLTISSLVHLQDGFLALWIAVYSGVGWLIWMSVEGFTNLFKRRSLNAAPCTYLGGFRSTCFHTESGLYPFMPSPLHTPEPKNSMTLLNMPSLCLQFLIL